MHCAGTCQDAAAIESCCTERLSDKWIEWALPDRHGDFRRGDSLFMLLCSSTSACRSLTSDGLAASFSPGNGSLSAGVWHPAHVRGLTGAFGVCALALAFPSAVGICTWCMSCPQRPPRPLVAGPDSLHDQHPDGGLWVCFGVSAGSAAAGLVCSRDRIFPACGGADLESAHPADHHPDPPLPGWQQLDPDASGWLRKPWVLPRSSRCAACCSRQLLEAWPSPPSSGLEEPSAIPSISLMLAGNAPQFPDSLFASIRTLTAHIGLVLATDSQSMAYQSVFAAGLILFLLIGAANFLIRKSGPQGQGESA